MQLACDILSAGAVAPIATSRCSLQSRWRKSKGVGTVDTAAKGAGTGAALSFGAPILAHGAGKSYSALADALRGYGGGLSRPAGKVLAQGRFEAAPCEVDGAVAARQRPRRAGNSAEARNILASALKSRETNAPTRLELRFRPRRPRRTIVVGEANNWMRRFHLRMPIILAAAARRGRLSKRPFER